MELFVGLHIPFPVDRELAHVQSRLRLYDSSGKYEPAANYHLTLRYIGERWEADKAAAQLKHIRHPRFSLTLHRLGMFENSESNVVWVNVRGESESLHALRKAVDDALAQAGMEAEELPFVPHISLAFDCNPDVNKHFASCQVQSLSFEVTCFHLYQVQQSQEGVSFRKLKTFDLSE